MKMEFQGLSDTLVDAFTEPDTKKRRLKIDKWYATAIPSLQETVQAAIKSLIEKLEEHWTDRSIESRREKWLNNIICLAMEIRLRNKGGKLPDATPTTVGSKERKLPNANVVTSGSADYDDDWGDSGSGRSPNDDRSDSMNPNNDAYQASMDNRSDQINPNNPAYWSSRGGRR